jgi:uroporphyrinogen III methyltransferase / synthase
MNHPVNKIPGSEKKQLSGKKILITRSKEKAGEFADLLRSAGAEVLLFPAFRITGPDSWTECDRAIDEINGFGTLAFTSGNAVSYFMQRFPEEKRNILQSKKIFAVGAKTNEAANQFNLNAEVITSDYTGKELGTELIKRVTRDQKILFPHGNKGRFEFLEVLGCAGYRVTDIIVYRNTGPGENEVEKFKSVLQENEIDVYTFFSPSSVKNVVEILSCEIPEKSVIAVIGPTTAKAARESGLKVDIVAPRATAEDLAKAIIDYYDKPGKK